MKLLELAFRSRNFLVSSEVWDDNIDELNGSRLFKKLNDEAEIRSKTGVIQVYSLWINDKPCCLAKLKPIDVKNKKYLDVQIILSDPSRNKNGFGSLLLWELFLALPDTILICGAVSENGEKLIRSFLKQYQYALTGSLKVLDVLSGDVETFNDETFFRKPLLSLVLECSPVSASRGTLGSHTFWLFDDRLFLDHL